MDYLIEALSTVIDKLTEAKGYIIAKQLMQTESSKLIKKKKSNLNFKNNVIKFKDLTKKD